MQLSGSGDMQGKDAAEARSASRSSRAAGSHRTIDIDHLAGLDDMLNEQFNLSHQLATSAHSNSSMGSIVDNMLRSARDDIDEESESEQNEPVWGGSRPGRSPNKDRDFEGAHHRIVADYFNGTDSVYDETDFERRYLLERPNFNRLRDKILGQGSFVHGKNATGRAQIHPLVRLMACLHMFVSGCPADEVDQYYRIGESTARDAFVELAYLVVENFEDEFLGCPDDDEIERMLEFNKRRGAPGMFGSWDCSHWKWKNCPTVKAGQYTGRKGTAIVHETVVDHDLECFYHSFGYPGSCNDINVLGRSDTLFQIMTGDYKLKAPQKYTINGTTRDWMYFLVDGIYPCWTIFICPWSKDAVNRDRTGKKKFFNGKQEGWRKDVERFYSVLAEECGVLAKPLQPWYIEDISAIVKCCVILHNMNVRSRKERMRQAGISGNKWWEEEAFKHNFPNIAGAASGEGQGNFRTLFAGEGRSVGQSEWLAVLLANMKDRGEHDRLMNDLTEHVWNYFRY